MKHDWYISLWVVPPHRNYFAVSCRKCGVVGNQVMLPPGSDKNKSDADLIEEVRWLLPDTECQ